jgi:acetolactate decarboxylase
MRELEARSRQTGEPVAHIVMSSLADTLEIDHSTLFQVSTSTALVEGVGDRHGGAVRPVSAGRAGPGGGCPRDGPRNRRAANGRSSAQRIDRSQQRRTG